MLSTSYGLFHMKITHNQHNGPFENLSWDDMSGLLVVEYLMTEHSHFLRKSHETTQMLTSRPIIELYGHVAKLKLNISVDIHN